MKAGFNIEDAVRKRYSVRNYSDREIGLDTRKEIEEFIGTLDNPFGNNIDFHFLDGDEMKGQQKLGTYGVIKGAKQYIGTTIKLDDMALLALGYEFEALVLYLAHMDIGTCWLGGTFDRKGFAEAMNVKEGELFPVITPYGYAAEKKHIKEKAMRKVINADKRKSWKELFFSDDFNTPLKEEDAGELAFPLEMVRQGPSASNKQPWRIVLSDKDAHFYEDREPGYSDRFPYDIQRVDMGIAAAHFDLAAKEKGITGHFDTKADPGIQLPENMEYVFSWIRD
ncbi:nitroreductase family protein [Gudongella sp. DL1XJH-153]|uniref:nitroreductase family protein n=1 Tax=Gudongella sp. DL1XJH-153 TaxID=3409804 RepID=UPI003BB495CD